MKQLFFAPHPIVNEVFHYAFDIHQDQFDVYIVVNHNNVVNTCFLRLITMTMLVYLNCFDVSNIFDFNPITPKSKVLQLCWF
jgi:hypothetical protein